MNDFLQDDQIQDETTGEAITVYDSNTNADDDYISMSGIQLPTYNEVNDKKVITAIRQVFKDFEPSQCDEAAQLYSTPDRLAQYIDDSISSIANVKMMNDSSTVMARAAIAARLWHMAKCIDTALKSAKYGENGVKKVADAMNTKMAQSTIYATRQIAKTLTLTDCWLLGARGCKPSHIRKLAAVTDDTRRELIKNTFIESVTDTRDDSVTTAALKQLWSAIAAPTSADFAKLSTSAPTEVMEDTELYPEYTGAVNMMKRTAKTLKQFTDNDKSIDILETIDKIYVTDTMPDAQTKLDTAIQEATTLKDSIKAACMMLSELSATLDGIINGMRIESHD